MRKDLIFRLEQVLKYCIIGNQNVEVIRMYYEVVYMATAKTSNNYVILYSSFDR